MIRRATIYSAFVVVIAAVAVLVICFWDQFFAARHWIAKIVIVLSALVLLACRWWVVAKQRRKSRACAQVCVCVCVCVCSKNSLRD